MKHQPNLFNQLINHEDKKFPGRYPAFDVVCIYGFRL